MENPDLRSRIRFVLLVVIFVCATVRIGVHVESFILSFFGFLPFGLPIEPFNEVAGNVQLVAGMILFLDWFAEWTRKR